MSAIEEPSMVLDPKKLQQSEQKEQKKKKFTLSSGYQKHTTKICLTQSPYVNLEQKVDDCIIFAEEIDRHDIKTNFSETSANLISNTLWLCTDMTKSLVKLDAEVCVRCCISLYTIRNYNTNTGNIIENEEQN